MGLNNCKVFISRFFIWWADQSSFVFSGTGTWETIHSQGHCLVRHWAQCWVWQNCKSVSLLTSILSCYQLKNLHEALFLEYCCNIENIDSPTSIHRYSTFVEVNVFIMQQCFFILIQVFLLYVRWTTQFQTKWEQAHCGLNYVNGVHSNSKMYTTNII